MNRTDINRISEVVLIPLFAELFGYKNLKTLNTPLQPNYPGIDLGDETARVAFQITSSADNEKLKETLTQFVPTAEESALSDSAKKSPARL